MITITGTSIADVRAQLNILEHKEDRQICKEADRSSDTFLFHTTHNGIVIYVDSIYRGENILIKYERD